MANPIIPALIILAVLVLVLVLMWLGWRRRRQQGAAIPMITDLPEGATVLAEVPAFYVASTRAGEPLERLALKGLSFRSRATVAVASEGVVIAARGEYPAFIPAAQILGALPATWTIDRVVEKDGLIALSWTSGETGIDSYIRVIEQSDHIKILDAIAQIVPAPASRTTESEITA